MVHQVGSMRGILYCLLLLGAGCESKPPATTGRGPVPAGAGGQAVLMGGGQELDLEAVRAADVSILFLGNSHTAMHDVPGIIAEMMRFQKPEQKVATHHLGVGFLEDVSRLPLYRETLEKHAWTCVVLQAQKISMSGRHNYSRQEGIDFARLAKERGARVCFFAEWGLRDVPGDGPRTQKVYDEMAKEAGVFVAPVGRAWDLALAKQPDLPLYAGDGNHQDELGAFLTACVLYGKITGDSPAPLAEFPYPRTDAATRKLLANVAQEALAPIEDAKVRP